MSAAVVKLLTDLARDNGLRLLLVADGQPCLYPILLRVSVAGASLCLVKAT